jgi:3-oxoadipate enol-lactonase
LPKGFEQAVADADTFFRQELPALQQWSFTQEHASRIAQPVLAVTGEDTAATFPERRALLLSWLPNVEPFELPAATHLLHVQNPRGMAEGLASFYARHTLPASS